MSTQFSIFKDFMDEANINESGTNVPIIWENESYSRGGADGSPYVRIFLGSTKDETKTISRCCTDIIGCDTMLEFIVPYDTGTGPELAYVLYDQFKYHVGEWRADGEQVRTSPRLLRNLGNRMDRAGNSPPWFVLSASLGYRIVKDRNYE